MGIQRQEAREKSSAQDADEMPDRPDGEAAFGFAGDESANAIGNALAHYAGGARARAIGEDEALAIVETHYGHVMAYCRRHAPSLQLAEDMAQETFLRFVRTRSSYVDRGKPLAYLLTIARNLCIDAGRASARMPCVSLDDIEEPSTSDAYPVELESLLADLSPSEREVVELRFDQGLGVVEIARVVGVSRFAVNRMLKRALAHVREGLASGRDEG